MGERSAQPEVAPNLPVTPMLDMTFQLLTFFILTYHPVLESKIDFSLPASAAGTAGEPAAGGLIVDVDADLTVEVRAQQAGDGAGSIAQIVVKAREGDTPVVDLLALRKHLEQVRQELPPTSRRNVQVTADSGLKYAFVIQVVDTCMLAGFDQVGFGPPPDLAPRD